MGGAPSVKIVHLKNPANLAWRLAQGQRMLGHDAVVFSRGDVYDFPFDYYMPSGAKWNWWLIRHVNAIRQADVVHIHGGIWRGELAYHILRMLKKRSMRIFVHYNGSEARQGGGLHHQRVADGFFYTDPDIVSLVPKDSIWVPQPVELPTIEPTIVDAARRGVCDRAVRPHTVVNTDRAVRFVHAPSSDALKGTAKVVEMFDEAFGPLRKYECLQFPGPRTVYYGKGADLWIVRGWSHERLQSVIAQADVVIDQISDLGIYGYASAEAMAYAKPVLSTIDRSLMPADCPVVFPCVSKLLDLASHASVREHVGALGRAYVERLHASEVVAQRVIDAYLTFK